MVGPAFKLLDPHTSARLLQLVAASDGTVHLAGLIIAKAHLERMGEDASLEFTYRLLLDGRGEGVRAEALEAAVVSCVRLAGAADEAHASSSAPAPAPARSPAAAAAASVTAPSASTTPAAPAPAKPHLHIAAVVRGAMLGESEGASTSGSGDGVDLRSLRLSLEGYKRWTKRCPALHAALSGLLVRVGGPTQGLDRRRAALLGLGPQLPMLAQMGKLPPDAALLQPTWAWALGSRLPPVQRKEWRLLFSSQRDGKSFNTFFGRVSATPGPTLTLVRDKGGALFGGYASCPWVKSGNFFGDVSSFLFTLEPALQVFPATGVNDNYQWCGVGFSQLPSGLGFGGAAGARGHFALYVEPSLDEGMSRPIATYGLTKSLASDQVFQIDTLECWLLQPPEDEMSSHSDSSTSGSRRGGSQSILNRNVEDRAIMALAGMKMHSDGVRDEPLEED
ncbi:hypothetical protein HYH03_001068 [Edaphochlamys debaryana]|uniref:TLDc domain-containing protein n=1 Tax=Edaphochlamys debaryana TaxID=47281 RepID=A0A835YHX2_9CHLO|nr:hypothetical protein HYH03_001068 [Edaphochlamys debaryana]|eukprot:KAG2501261.1 hypothetical protein HYH03_001068 [Edaphochlamys debaryana]